MSDEVKGEMPEVEQQEQAQEQTAEKVELSKAEFDKMAAALKEANKEAAARRKRLEQLEAEEAKRKEAELTETEKATKRAQELEAKLKAYERAEAQRRVAEKTGLPHALATRLMGETDEDMEADAKALLESLPKPEKPTPGIQPTNPPTGTKAKTEAERKAEIFGAPVTSPFDPEFVRQKGGGVVFSEKE